MHNVLDAEMLARLYSCMVIGVSIILAGGGLGFAVGCGVVCGKTLECMARLPDSRPALMLDTLIFTGFVSNFPFIVLAFGAWFLFANPFVDGIVQIAKSMANGTFSAG